MARRTKPRVVWLPQTNLNSLGAAAELAYQIFSVDAAGTTGDFAVGEIPLVIDSQDDPLDPASSLSDIENSGYRLRRIVGKIYCNLKPSSDDSPVVVIVTAGIIVRRSDPTTGTSLGITAGIPELLSPGTISSAGDPWIWRRSWLFRDNTATGAATSPSFAGTLNSNYGASGASAVDGPHIDQKTARIISSEERLFLNVSNTIVSPGGDPQILAQCTVLTDLRVLASMRTSSGNRRNASR